jgi:hypothetical protein
MATAVLGALARAAEGAPSQVVRDAYARMGRKG